MIIPGICNIYISLWNIDFIKVQDQTLIEDIIKKEEEDRNKKTKKDGNTMSFSHDCTATNYNANPSVH